MNMRVIIRADASAEIGGGHVYRTCVLGSLLKERNAKVIYATKPESLGAVPSLLSHGFEVITLDSVSQAEEPSVLKNHSSTVDLFILDHYQRGIEFEQAVRSFSKKLFVLDDLPTRHHACDFLLDQTLGRLDSAYSSLVPLGCRVFTGPKYALLRRQFADARREGRCRKRERVKRLLVMVGASNISGILDWIIDALRQFEIGLTVDIVSASEAHAKLNGRTVGRSVVYTHQHVSEMASLIAEADVAIGAAGSASWERCCLGLPALLFILAENQRDVCESLHRAGAAINLGRFPGVSKDCFLQELRKLVTSHERLSSMSERAASICDGRGAERLIERVFQ